MSAIFRDDSTIDDKRDAAFERLYAMCPVGLRVTMRPFIQQAINNASPEQIESLLVDVERVQSMASAGDANGIADIARNYGATDAQISSFMGWIGDRPNNP